MINRKEMIVLSVTVAILLVWSISLFSPSNLITGNAIRTINNGGITLINCNVEDGWKVCDAVYPKGKDGINHIGEGAYAERIKVETS